MIQEERLDQPNPFADDDGTISPLLAAALDCEDVSEKCDAIVRALMSSRVFVAVFPPDEGESEARQGSVEIAGREALAIFSDAEAVSAFSEQARPLPLLGRNAAALLSPRQKNGQLPGTTMKSGRVCVKLCASLSASLIFGCDPRPMVLC